MHLDMFIVVTSPSKSQKRFAKGIGNRTQLVVQILETLSDSLCLRLFAAAKALCSEILSMLPAQLRMSALHAKYPNIQKHLSIHIAPCDAKDTHWALFWKTILTVSSIQDIELTFQFGHSEVLQFPITGLTGLTRLSIRGADVSITGVDTKPEALHGMRHLSLSDCTGGNCTGSKRAPKVVLSMIGELLVHMTGLEHLSLQDYNWARQDLDCVTQPLGALTNLKHLNLAYNNLKDDGVVSILSALQHVSKLTFLDVTENGLNSMGQEKLAELMTQMPHLQSLRNIGNFDGECIIPHLGSLKNLRHLDLSYLFIRNQAFVEFGKHLAEMTQLTYLATGKCTRFESTRQVLPSLSGLLAMKDLKICCAPLFGEGVRLLLQSIAPLRNLQRLSIPRICFDDNSAELLREFLQRRYSGAVADVPQAFLQVQSDHILPLLHLNVGSNLCNPAGISALVNGVVCLTALTSLNLSGTKFDQGTAEQLVQIHTLCIQTLSNLRLLEKLDLSFCGLHLSMIRGLAPAFGNLTPLVELNLGSNRMGEGCISLLAPHIANLSGLNNLNLTDCIAAQYEWDVFKSNLI